MNELTSEHLQLLQEIERLKEEIKKKEIVKIEGFKVSAYYDNVVYFREKCPFFYDKAGLFWWWDKENFKYILVDEVDIMTAIDKGLGFAGETVTSGIKAGYLEAFRRVGRENIPKNPPKNWVQFKDKIINIITSEKMEVTSEFFFTNPIPWTIGDDTETPVMDKIFTEWIGGGDNKILYEILAYCTLPSYPINRIFCLLGGGSNGKSKYLEIIRKFIGASNVTTTELGTLLNSRFEKTRLHKKLVCMMGETNCESINETDLLKKLSGDVDIIGFEYKNKGFFEDINFAKIIIATNNLPDTIDRTDGFYRRWLIIDFPNQFTEKVDIFKTIPDEEFSALACKSIAIMRDILLKREFYNEGTLEERRKRYEDRSDPFGKFWKDSIIESEGHISKRQFKEKLDQWCRENRFRIASDRTVFVQMKERGIFEGKVYAEWHTNEGIKPQYRAWMNICWKE